MWTLVEPDKPDTLADQLPILDEPLALAPAPVPRRPWWKTLPDLIVIVLLLLALPAQILLFNFDSLTQNNQIRPWLELLCEQAQCTLPARSDINQFMASNLRVIDHPEQPFAREVTVTLQNRAAFAQPFPALELLFTDIAGNAVAGKRIQPIEYLQTNQTVDASVALASASSVTGISFWLADPGSDAINYRLTLTQADTAHRELTP